MSLGSHLGAASLVVSSLLVGSSASAADPTKAECIAANEQAQDLRGSGKLLEARAQLAVCIAQSCPGAIRQDCVLRLGDVEKALPTLVLIARDSSGNDVGGVHATIDGKAVSHDLNGTAMPLDPGEHKIVLEAAGLPRTEKTVVLHEGEKARREVVTFSAGQPAGAGAAGASGGSKPPAAEAKHESGGHDAVGGGGAGAGAQDTGTSSTGATEPVPPPSSAGADAPHPGHTQRLIGVSMAGAGLVGIVIGSIFGIVTKSTYHQGFDIDCGGSTRCSSKGFSEVQSAYDQATISTVGFIAGGVLLAGGAAIYFTAPRAGEVAIAPSLGDRGAGLTMRGAW
jgi:hypothetical protein